VTIEASLKTTISKDNLELTLIDAGATEINESSANLIIIGPLATRGTLEKILKERTIPITHSFATYTVPNNQHIALTPEQKARLALLTTALTDHPDIIDVYTDAAVE
jgi:transcriptional/translational regulatory protein YebC/TACO1